MKSKTGIRAAFAAVAAVLLLGTSSVAYASDVDVTAVVDATIPTGSVELSPGGSSGITINLEVTGNQVGTATFEVYTNWTLTVGGTFAGSLPKEFTVAPQSGGASTPFTTSATVAVAAGVAPGTYTLTVAAFDITNSNPTGAKLGLGDSATYTVTVPQPAPPIDITPPVITPTLNPAAPNGANGWYNTDVTLTWTVIDPDGAITSTTGCGSTTVSVDQLATDYTCSATSAGGTASEIVTIKRDATAPVVTLVGGGLADGGEYYFGAVPAPPTCDATDATSGVNATGCVVSGYSTAVGEHTVSATATDLAGNAGTSTTITYEVLAWTLKGFYQPVDLGSLNLVKSGSTVPLKFEVFAGDTELTDVAVVATFKVGTVPCDSLEGVPTDDIEQYSTGATVLRYDTTGGQFIQNWQTPKGKAGTCYKVTLTTDDGSSVSADFKLK
ncbi:PxKF domain-containing protein [Microbacterium trichothecenolyticum]